MILVILFFYYIHIFWHLYNLKKNLHSQTYKSLFDDIKLKLNKEISDKEFESLIKEYE